MLLQRRVPLVVEVVQQRRRRVELDKRVPLWSNEPQPVGFRLAHGRHACFHGQRVLPQALARRPRGKQMPGLRASIILWLIHRCFSPVAAYGS